MLRTITPKRKTPTASFWGEKGHCEKVTIKGVLVARKGQSPVANGNDELSPYIERAAYIVDRMLGFNLVPTTVLQLRDGQLVSVQKWISAKTASGYNPPLLRVFDYIIWNLDRHGSNWLIKNRKVYAIDNAYSFYYETHRRQWYNEDRAVKDLSTKQRVRLQKRLKALLAEPQVIRDKLKGLIGKKEINDLISRMNDVLEQCQGLEVDEDNKQA